jgi:hypothetical protein
MTIDNELAALGAAVKYAQLQRQMDELKRRYPELRRLRTAMAEVRGVRKVVRRRRRRLMSKSQRAAVSARMKKYWAARRKASK